MITAEQHLLADFANWAVLALLLGLLAHHGLRRTAAVEPAGNVPRGPSKAAPDVFDLLIALGLVFLMRSQVAAVSVPVPADPPSERAAADVVTSVSAVVLLGLVLMVYLRGARGRSLTDWFGMGARSVPWLVRWTLGLGVPAFLVVYGTSMAAQHFIWQPLGFGATPQKAVELLSTTESPVLRLLMGVSACVVAPVIEETIFRGFLYPVFKRFTHAGFAAVFTALFFGVVHANLGAFLPLSVLGLVLVFAWERGGLLLPVALHALFNTASLVFMAVAHSSATP